MGDKVTGLDRGQCDRVFWANIKFTHDPETFLVFVKNTLSGCPRCPVAFYE